MKVLYIYRHPDMGFSIGKVFRPIEEEMRKYAEVDAVYLPIPNYKPAGLWKNIRTAVAAVKQKKYDIVHITGAEHYLIPFLRKQNIVVTVHDLGFFTNHGLSIRTLWKYCLWIKTLPLAKRATFISKKSLKEAEGLVKFKSGQAVVIHDPIGREYVPNSKTINTSCPTILHVGTKPNKNLTRTIDALNGLPCKLRIVGEISSSDHELLIRNGVDFSNVCNISDEELLQEYQNADIVNFPSLTEGFGMPVIEGQGVGRLVITSNLEPMKSIAGGGAVLCNPSDVGSIRDAYKRCIGNPDYCMSIVNMGNENIKKYRVQNIAKEFFALYADLINKHKS